MTKKEFLDLVAEAYTDTDIIQMYYDEDGEYIEDEAGDTLAEFIVKECLDTFCGSCELDILTEAVRVMEQARDDVVGVIEALEKRLEEIK